MEPSFNKNVNSYNIKVPYEVEKLDLSYITSNEKAKVEITGNENFKVGSVNTDVYKRQVEDTDKAEITTDLSNPFPLEFDTRNKIEVTVKSEDDTTKTYTIYITRSHRQYITLKDLTINGVTISDFTNTKDNYTLTDLPYNTHQLNIVATPCLLYTSRCV